MQNIYFKINNKINKFPFTSINISKDIVFNNSYFNNNRHSIETTIIINNYNILNNIKTNTTIDEIIIENGGHYMKCNNNFIKNISIVLSNYDQYINTNISFDTNELEYLDILDLQDYPYFKRLLRIKKLKRVLEYSA